MTSSRRKFWSEGPGSFMIAIGFALVIRWALVEAYVIPSGSMMPSLLVHDHIFVNKIVFGLRLPFSEKWLSEWSEPQHGDVIVFKYPEDKDLFYIKRVIGLPGDRVFYENGNLYVNDQLIDKSLPVERVEDAQWLRDDDFPGEAAQGGKSNYVHWQERMGEKSYSILLRKSDHSGETFGPYTVPPHHYFVMGDNRDNSQDSRAWDPQASRASGIVVIKREGAGPTVKLSAGTTVRTDTPGVWTQRFRTTEDVELKDGEVRVPVRAVDPGVLGNVKAGAISVLESPPQGLQVKVENPADFTGGEDRRFVPREYLVGRAMFVWLSCEKTLPVVSFLCNPMQIRWGRFFHAVQ